MKTDPALRRSSASRYRYAYLLSSLLLVIVLRPFLPNRFLGIGLIDLLLFATLVVGALATASSRAQLVVVGVLAVLSAGTRIAWLASESPSLLYAFLALGFTFYIVVAVSVLRSLLAHSARVSGDAICGAVSVYLLLGLAWTMVYTLLELVVPGSFTIGPSGGGVHSDFERFIGFSFTTLTTLGYGNIAPTTPRADVLTTLEAIVGQVYLAIVIARLVSLQIIQSRD